ncbi:hypothetical protein JW930_04700 [Candidatus Woesearchaeota archaeon]|nr:hypothetical protein [Candidatus Woesearchaeota archaeon]
MGLNKRGDNWTALLIAMIAAVIILYVLMLPPEYRAELLEENFTPVSGEEYSNISILMSKAPGTLSFLASDQIDIDLSSFTLYTKKEAEILFNLNSLYIKKSLFDEEFKNISFSLQNIEFLENIMLSFTASKYSGRLAIKLNGNTIMEQELTTASPPPLELPKALLKEENTLVFEVSGPGMEFWKANEYNLIDIKITGDTKDISGQENKQIFVVTEQEKNNLLYGELTFIVECSQTESSPMEIYLNKRQIYVGIPDCSLRFSPLKIEEDKIIEGDNHLRFRSENGNYQVYQGEFRLKLKEPVYPTYYFNLPEESYQKIREGDADINISLVFPNSIDYKKGVIFINSYQTEIETYDDYYSRNINTFIRKDNNAVEIRPKKDKLEITQLEIVYAVE